MESVTEPKSSFGIRGSDCVIAGERSGNPIGVLDLFAFFSSFRLGERGDLEGSMLRGDMLGDDDEVEEEEEVDVNDEEVD